MPKPTAKRLEALLPGGVPRYVRCYDSGPDGPADRYTAVFSGRHVLAREHWIFPYVAMNCSPMSPWGIGMSGETQYKPCDVDRWGFAPAIGRKGRLGRRIPFAELPEECRRLVMGDYLELWDLKGGAK